TAADWADYLGWLPVFAAGGVLFALFLSRRKLSAPLAHLVALAFGVGFVCLYFLSAADRGNLIERMVWLSARIGAWVDAAVSGGDEPALVGTARHLMLAGAIISGALLSVAWVLPSGGISQKVSEVWYDMTGPWQAFQSHFDRLFAALNAPERSARGLNFGRTL